MQQNMDKKKVFNPLAPSVQKDPAALIEKEMRELIKQDVVRTNQEFDYFQKQTTKDMLIAMLFLWGKTYPEYGYKQGMNEILAIVLLVFDTERIQSAVVIDWDKMSDREIAEKHILEFLFDPKYLQADVFMVHDRIL